jgi:gluconate 5-dehydrogenase
MTAKLLGDPGLRQELVARIPLGRVAMPADVVGPVLFLCSPAAAYMTGQVLYVDGGFSSWQ